MSEQNEVAAEAVEAVEAENEYQPKVPPKVRDVAYFVGLGLSFVCFIAAGGAYIWFDEPVAAAVASTAGLVGTGYGIISNGLGVVYRPGAQKK